MLDGRPRSASWESTICSQASCAQHSPSVGPKCMERLGSRPTTETVDERPLPVPLPTTDSAGEYPPAASGLQGSSAGAVLASADELALSSSSSAASADELDNNEVYSSVQLLCAILDECRIRFVKVDYIINLASANMKFQFDYVALLPERQKDEIRRTAMDGHGSMSLFDFDGILRHHLGPPCRTLASRIFAPSLSELQFSLGVNIMCRQQDVPTERFTCASELETAMMSTGTRHGIQLISTVAVASHGWLHWYHPDPHGFHLRQLADYFEISDWAGWHQALFVDFMCLFQYKRTLEEEDLFRKSLENLHYIYAHNLTNVLRLQDVPDFAASKQPYLHRGWCIVEKMIACTKRTDFTLGNVRVPQQSGSEKQQLPLTPNRMNEMLESLHFTNKNSDLNKVKDMYSKVFNDRFRKAERLSFGDRIDDGSVCDDLEDLLELLSHCRSLRHLSLAGSTGIVNNRSLLLLSDLKHS